jgi:outer membrane cobalamin receptor
LCLAIITALSTSVHAQLPKYTISGYLKDSLSTEALISASIYNRVNKLGTSTNQYGFYSLTLPAGDVELLFSYVGYGNDVQKFSLNKDTVLNINLSASGYNLGEVEVTATRTASIQETTQMSAVNIPVAQIKSIPAFFGEVDVLKVLQLMPGIQSGSEGSSGLYVRGGGPDQNLMLLDGVPLYNVSHLFGFFSVFNADAINNVEIFKGGFPSYYGGRVSSVVDINMKEGNMQKFHGEGSIGVISAKMMLEGPIIKDRTSFIVSARRTYIDMLLKPLIASAQNDFNEKVNAGYYFYDFTAKINHRFSAKDRIYLSFYSGDDKFYVENEYNNSPNISEYDAAISWGNILTAFRWNHLFTNKLFSNVTLTYSRYRFLTDLESKETYEDTDHSVYPPKQSVRTDYYGANYNSGIEDWSGKIAFDYIPSPNHYVRFGASVIYHTFNPGAMAYTVISTTSKYGAKSVRGIEYSAYAGDDVKLSDRLKANVGLHWSGFSVRNTFYHILQPRVSARYLLTNDVSLKASYSRMGQYIHLLTNSNIGLPTDIWVPVTDMLKPQSSHQAALGVVRNFKERYEISLEGYYKTMNNVIEYREGASFINADNNWENKVLQGDGTSYGVELFARKNLGSLTGWVGYTLSWTNRQFDQLNDGKPFWYKYDRRHDVSIVVTNRFSKRIEMSGTWVFGTGNCISIPIGIYEMPNPITPTRPETSNLPFNYQEYYDFSKRGNYRMNAYHRLDLSISFIKKRKRTERRWVIGIFNAYNRKNPFYMDVREQHHYDNNTHKESRKYEYVQYSLFPIIPSISYQLKF